MAQHELPESSPSEPVLPVRMCVGCRERELISGLVRVVARDYDGVVVAVIDFRRRLPGRGAWLHSRPECLHQAERRRAFGRALRVSGRIDTSELTRIIESAERIGTESVHEENRYTNS
ncbi:YlxR family protein [Actinomycetes bacterium M1A6_2h]